MKTPNKRVRYNFTMKVPRGKFTMAKLMALNPNVNYITLHKKLQKSITQGQYAQCGVLLSPAKRGRSQKLYSKIIVEKVMSEINPVSGLKSLQLAE
jgi:hypothetical protein